MNGQLSEQPLVELIREILTKSMGGRLRLERDKVQVVAYFDSGHLLYAASNLRTLRLREYLEKSNLISQQALVQFTDRVSDTDIVKALCAQKLLTSSAAEQVQARQVSDTLRLALLWTEGAWEFDSRSRLSETLNLKLDVNSLLQEASRRLPPEFVASRFSNPGELISPAAPPLTYDQLLPAEGFLLSRLDRPMPLRDLIAVSGVGERETIALVYSLALTGLLSREHWKSSFRNVQPTSPPEPEKVAPTAAREQSRETEIELNDVESFLARVTIAQTHYDVLGVEPEVASQGLKAVYYQLARQYHPDRFRQAEASMLTRLESAFARITQAYDTLRDDKLRASYNSKLAARKKADRIADSAPKPTVTEAVSDGVAEPSMSAYERAEVQFKEGLTALELGERKVAIGLFASAARAVPKEPRYRALYGHLLAADARTRRAAETELLVAIKLDPGNSEYRVMLAELYRDLGLKLRAKGEAERAAAADPNNRKARDLLRALK
jgi:DnaJ-domain-containing protein 1